MSISHGDPGKPGRDATNPDLRPFPTPSPGPTPTPRPPVQFRPIDFTVAGRDALDDEVPDRPEEPGYRDRVNASAMALDPIRQMQSTVVQSASHLSDYTRGELWQYPGTLSSHLDEAITHAARYRDILVAAAVKAEAVLAEFKSMTDEVKTQMGTAKTPDEVKDIEEAVAAGEASDNALSTLALGGYEIGADPSAPTVMSDIAGPKSGSTTLAQAQAINRADVGTEPGKPTPSDAPSVRSAPPAPPATEVAARKVGRPPRVDARARQEHSPEPGTPAPVVTVGPTPPVAPTVVASTPSLPMFPVASVGPSTPVEARTRLGDATTDAHPLTGNPLAAKPVEVPKPVEASKP